MAENKMSPKSKGIYGVRNGTFTVAEWEDGHKSVQFRVSQGMFDAAHAVITGKVNPTDKEATKDFPSGAVGYATYGSFDFFSSDFFGMIPAFDALAEANGYRLVLEKKP